MENHPTCKTLDQGLKIFPPVLLDELEPNSINGEPEAMFPRLFIAPSATEDRPTS